MPATQMLPLAQFGQYRFFQRRPKHRIAEHGSQSDGYFINKRVDKLAVGQQSGPQIVDVRNVKHRHGLYYPSFERTNLVTREIYPVPSQDSATQGNQFR